jgi:hypothetical protein
VTGVQTCALPISYSSETDAHTFGAKHAPKNRKPSVPHKNTARAAVPWDAIVLKNWKYVGEMTETLERVGPAFQQYAEEARGRGAAAAQRPLAELLEKELHDESHLDDGDRARILGSLEHDLQTAYEEYFEAKRGQVAQLREDLACTMLAGMSPASVKGLPGVRGAKRKDKHAVNIKRAGVAAKIRAGDLESTNAVLTSTPKNAARRLAAAVTTSLAVEEREALPDQNFENMVQLYKAGTITKDIFDSFAIGYQEINPTGFLRCADSMGIE